MTTYVYATAGGKTLFDSISDSQVKVVFKNIAKIIKESGLAELTVKPLVKNTKPPLWEIKVDRNRKFIRLHYFIDDDGCINICNVIEKKKNKAQEKDIQTSLKRMMSMREKKQRREV